MINESPVCPEKTWHIDFTCNNQNFTGIQFCGSGGRKEYFHLIYFTTTTSIVAYMIPYAEASYWTDASGNATTYALTPRKTVTFSTAPTGDLLTWLQANAVKQ